MQKVYLKEELEHGKYLGRPLRDLKELADWIPSNEIYLLEKYGAWMEALVRQEIKPVTEDQKRFIKVVNENGPLENSFEKAWGNAVSARKKNFEKAWGNAVPARKRNQTRRIKKNQTQLVKRERRLSTRPANFNGISNHDPMENTYIKPSGGIGFLAGICLAVLAFSIVPVIPVVIAFFAGHWVSKNI